MTQGTLKTVNPIAARQQTRPLSWFFMVSALGTAGILLSLAAAWGTLRPSPLWPAAAAVIGWALCAAAGRLGTAAGWTLRLLPWCAVLLLGPAEIWRGFLLWVNCILNAWNTLHEGGLPLLNVQATAQSVRAVSVAVGLACGQLTWRIVSHRRMLLSGILGASLMLVQLLCGAMSPLGCALLLASELMLWMCVPERAPSAAAFRLALFCAAALGALALLLPTTRLTAVDTLRTAAADTIHTIRYGRDTLPEGHLDRASMLGQGDDVQLTVTSGQEKTLYLRAFVGDRYADGVWKPLPDAAYTGRYAGMLDWLREQDFDPLTQPAQYAALTGGTDAPEENRVTVDVTAASRNYLYAPSSLAELSLGQARAQHDTRYKTTGLTGESIYVLTERSTGRPSELTTTAAWVTDPQTEEQKRYSAAEAVYRTFVYETYATPAPELAEQLDALFWQDYAPAHDSVYQAVCHVRDCLAARQTDAAAAPDDPIRAFLTDADAGGTALYAAAGVQALRAHGIPARYVEGYYLSAEALARSTAGRVQLTGADTHAWCEVYFDGAGWLPVDFTPGYYYDARTLEQLVATPDNVRKTAALQPDGTEQGLTDINVPAGTNAGELLLQAKKTLLSVLGALALLVVMLTVVLALLELVRLLRTLRERAVFRKADPLRQAEMLRERIFLLLRLRGFDACLGWQAEKTDAALVGRVPDVVPGEYCRVVILLEKAVYGEQPPEEFELRTLLRFSDKLSDVRDLGFGATYWRVRYACMHLGKKPQAQKQHAA